MARRQNLGLLLAWFLLAASASRYDIIKVKAEGTANFNLRSLQPSFHSQPTLEYGSLTKVDEKRINRKGSGPNPIGNRHRPSRP